MKISILYLLILIFLLITSLNTANAQTKVGIKAGVNFFSVMMRDENGKKINTQSVPGMLVGLTVDIPVAGDIYIQPAAQYSRKGYKQESGGFYGSASNFKVSASYVEVPINLLYRPHLGTGNL